MSNDNNTVFELRQYTLHAKKRDVLIDLFERHFLDGQEATGIRVVGQFRDADDADRFVWVRAFRDMPSRADALRSFYGGSVWKAHREVANSTMIDSDNVLLLRPVDASDRLQPQKAALVVATVYLLAEPAGEDFVRFFETQIRPAMTDAGAHPTARLATEYAANNFPALPVRAGEHAFVWFAAFATAADYDGHLAKLRASTTWNEVVQPALAARLRSAPQLLRLLPTAHSRLGRGAGMGCLHDFDFLAGRWKVKNRRLTARGVGSGDWEDFDATSEAALHLGGVANVDEIRFPTKNWSGMTMRVFDRATRQWSIYWVNSEQGRLLPPVVGGFDGEHGEFYGEDTDDGRPVKVRFRWTKKLADAARWEQAFSYDDGNTWEPNWVMDFSRTS